MKPDDYLLDRLATDLRLAGKAERTVEAYIGAVRRLGRACGKALAAIDEEDIRAYLVGMVRDDVARGTFSINLCGIRFFYRETLGREWSVFGLARPRYDKKLPVVLSRSPARGRRRDPVWLPRAGALEQAPFSARAPAP